MLRVARSTLAAASITLALGRWMLALTGRAKNSAQGEKRLKTILREGAALKMFKRMVRAQGGDPRVADDPDRLPLAKISAALTARRGGYITRLDALETGRTGVTLGAGRERMEDRLDYGAGIHLRRKVGDPVRKGTEIARLYASSASRVKAARAELERAVEIGPRRPRVRPVIRRVWR